MQAPLIVRRKNTDGGNSGKIIDACLNSMSPGFYRAIHAIGCRAVIRPSNVMEYFMALRPSNLDFSSARIVEDRPADPTPLAGSLQAPPRHHGQRCR